MQFQIANLYELFRDIGDAVDFQTFWKIFEGHARAAIEDLQGIMPLEGTAKDFFNIELWRPSVESIWKEVKAEPSRRNGDSRVSNEPPARDRDVISLRDGVRMEAAAVSKLFFVIVPPGADGGAAESKITVKIQNRRREHVGTALVKPNISNADPDDIRRFIRTLLVGNGSLANSLRSQDIYLDKDGPEITVLANQLGSYSPLRLPYSNGRRRRSRR